MIPMSDLFLTFGRIGLLSFGGPAAQIALMHRVLVDEKKWLSDEEYLSALSFCMLLPGPEAMQLATYAGWRQRGIPGGLLAGLLFVLPGALVVLALSAAYAAYGNLPIAAALFLGVKACVVVIVIEALLRVAKRGLKSTSAYVLAGLSFLAIFAFALPFPLLVLAAGLYGFVTARSTAPLARPLALAHLPKTLAIWGALWWAPIALAALTGQKLLTEVGLYFSRLAVVTFGGAYAVLAYMAQSVVAEKGWLTTGAMMDGLGLAETTPGPLILVTEFVGYQAGHAQGGWPLAVAAAAMTLWVTFVPCFLWIFAGAPMLAQLTAQPRLKSALAAITAAVVGVILSLSLWFALHVFFGQVSNVTLGPLALPLPHLSSLNPAALAIALIAGIGLLRFHVNLLVVLALSALAGVVLGQM